jgi:hypothetical protein
VADTDTHACLDHVLRPKLPADFELQQASEVTKVADAAVFPPLGTEDVVNGALDDPFVPS